jgi:hypothetical protein
MPRKKHVQRANSKNAKKVRNAKMQRFQGEFLALILADTSKKYHGHRVLPPDMIKLVKEMVPNLV